MPAAEQFTPPFVKAFVTRCYTEGLTKEAATYLLELTSLAAAHQNPAFEAGFMEKLAEEGLEKNAWSLAGKLMTGGLALGGLGLGANKAYDAFRKHNRQPWSDVPLYGVYDPASAAAGEKAKLDAASKGVAELNAKADADGKRRYELQQVVNSGGPGAAAAIAELQTLRKSPYSGHRARYGQELDTYHTGLNENLSEVQTELSDLNSSRNSLWNRTRNFFGMPKDFDAEERELVAQQARLSEQARLSQTLRDRLSSGSTTFSSGVPSREDMQSRFFPTR